MLAPTNQSAVKMTLVIPVFRSSPFTGPKAQRKHDSRTTAQCIGLSCAFHHLLLLVDKHITNRQERQRLGSSAETPTSATYDRDVVTAGLHALDAVTSLLA